MSENEILQEVVPSPQAGPEPSDFSRMFGVIWSPQKVFESVVRKPTFLAPFLFLLIFNAVVALVIYKPVIVPYQLQAMEQKSPDMPASQRAQMQKGMESPLGMAAAGVFGAIGGGLMIVLWAAVFYLVFTLLSTGRADFRAVFAVTVYAGMIGVVHSIVMVPMMLAKGDPRVALGPAVFMDWPEPMTFGFALLRGLDVFSLWAWAVAAVGLAVLYRKPLPRVLTTVAVIFVVGLLLQATISGLFHFGS